MIYIKPFNESSSSDDKLYTELEDFFEFNDTHKIEDVSLSDKSYFSLLNPKDVNWEGNKIFNIETKTKGKDAAIIKFEDDWWVVFINSYTVFLCDTKEGVVEVTEFLCVI